MAEEQVLDLTEQYLIRKDKLAKLKEEGHDPYTITKFGQDAFSADLREEFKDLPAETDSGITELESRDLNGYTLHLAKIDQEKIAWSIVTFAAAAGIAQVAKRIFIGVSRTIFAVPSARNLTRRRLERSSESDHSSATGR